MSYPWWRFKVTFADEPNLTHHFATTDMSPTYAMRELLEALYTAWEFEGMPNLYRHREVLRIEYDLCLTYGIDPESDRRMQEEAESGEYTDE